LAQSVKVKFVLSKRNWSADSKVTLDVTPIGDMANRVTVSTTTSPIRVKKNHIYGGFKITVTANDHGPQAPDEDVQLDLVVRRTDPGVSEEQVDKSHALVTLDFPGTRLSKEQSGQPQPGADAIPPLTQPGTQPIVIGPPSPVSSVPQASFTWQISAKIPYTSLENGNLVFFASPASSVQTSVADRVWITPAFKYQVTTSPTSDPNIASCTVTVTVKAYKGTTGFTKTIPIVGTLAIYEVGTGDLKTSSSVTKSFPLIFPKS